MIKINSKTNKKLVQNFPQDPYSDITIITRNQRLNLVLAYLGIDSNYFDTVDPDTREVNLSELEEDPLIRVLRSLYGSELQSQSVADLNQLYKVITALGIEDYKQNIINEIKLHPNLMDSIQMLQFSFSHNILVSQFKTHHFVSNLKILEDNRNYLQLNKVTARTINQILIEYEKSLKEKSHQTINNILENFLNRNSLSPANYFTEQLETLKMVWEKFHHTINYVQKIKTSDRIKASTIFGFQSGRTSLTLGAQKCKIAILEQQIQQKNRIISKLRQENLQLKRQLHFQRSKTLSQSHSGSISSQQANHSRNSSFLGGTQAIKQFNESSQWSKQQFEATKSPKFVKKDDSVYGDKSGFADRSGQFDTSSFEAAFESSHVIKQTKQPQFINKINSRR